MSTEDYTVVVVKTAERSELIFLVKNANGGIDISNAIRQFFLQFSGLIWHGHIWIENLKNAAKLPFLGLWKSSNNWTEAITPKKKNYLVCVLWSGGIIGTYIYKNDNGETVTVNSKRYGLMITDFSWPAKEQDLDIVWFQLDATCPTTRANTSLLREKFLSVLTMSNVHRDRAELRERPFLEE